MSILRVDTIAPLTGDSMTISGSLLFTAISGSFSGSFSGNGSGLTGITSSAGTASYIELSNVNGSASLATRLTGLESFSSSLDATFATDAQLNAATSSLSGSISSLSSSFLAYTSSQNALNSTFATTGSNVFQGLQTISGSLIVTGSITALSASITYLETVYQTSSIIFSSGSNILGDASNDVQTLFGTVDIKTGPLLVTGSINATQGFTGSFTGSLTGTATSASTAFARARSTTWLASLARRMRPASSVFRTARNAFKIRPNSAPVNSNLSSGVHV